MEPKEPDKPEKPRNRHERREKATKDRRARKWVRSNTPTRTAPERPIRRVKPRDSGSLEFLHISLMKDGTFDPAYRIGNTLVSGERRASAPNMAPVQTTADVLGLTRDVKEPT